jgi:hypothetical protein
MLIPFRRQRCAGIEQLKKKLVSKDDFMDFVESKTVQEREGTTFLCFDSRAPAWLTVTALEL